MKLCKVIMLVALLAAVPTIAPAQASSVRSVMYGPWELACPRGMRVGEPSCMIRYQAPGTRPGFGIDWMVLLDASGNSRIATSGWSRTTCQRIALSEDVGRYYRLADERIPVWRIEDHARRLLTAMRSHIPSFGNCRRQAAYSEAFPETLLDGQEADLVRALIAAETTLRGRAPDPNEGVTTTANLAWVDIRGPRESLDRLAAAAVEQGWTVESRNAGQMYLGLPANYRPGNFDALSQRMNSLGLTDIEVWLIGHYGPTRVER